MPLFTSASDFQINGGSFFDTAGDINIVTQHTVGLARDSDHPLSALQFVSEEGPTRPLLLGADRNGQNGGAVRMAPYGILPVLDIDLPLTHS